MSINAVSGVGQIHQKSSQPATASPSTGKMPFGQQLDDIQTTQTLAARGNHHHQGAVSQSTANTAASAAQTKTPAGAVTALLAHLLG
jgi:hypothetical protein